MKNLKFLIWCINVHFLYSESVAADDILAMLQSSLRVNHQGLEGEQPEKEDMGVPDMKSISRLEEIVMARVREGLGGDDKLSDSINVSVKQMFTGIIATTAANNKTIFADIKEFSMCNTKMWSEYDKAIPLEREFWDLGNIYPKCTSKEAELKVKNTKSTAIKNAASDNRSTQRKFLETVEYSCKNVCAKNKYENYKEELEKLTLYYGKCIDKIKVKIEDVAKAEEVYNNSLARYDLDNKMYEAMKNKCKLIAYRMNKKKCEAVAKLSTACSFHEECWRLAKKRYDDDKVRISAEQAKMMIEWRALTRIQCYLLVLNTQKDNDQAKEKAQLGKCINITAAEIKTEHLELVFPQIPPKPKCPKDAWCPCTEAYTNYYYKTGPKNRCTNNIVEDYKCKWCKKGGKKNKKKKNKRR